MNSVRKVEFASKDLEATVTNDPLMVTKWIRETYKIYNMINKSHKNLIIGLDVKWKPSEDDDEYFNEIAVLQLCYKKRVLIYQIIRSKFIPLSLIAFLNDEKITFTGVAMGEKFFMLQRYSLARGGENYREFFLSRNKDLQDDRKYNQNGEKSSLPFILKDLTGYDMEKEKDMTISNWEVKQLSEEQVRYACIVAYASYLIGKKPKSAEKYAHEEEPCKPQKLELVSTEVENQKSRKEFSAETSWDGNELASFMEEEREVGAEREELTKDEQDEVMETDAKP